MIVGDAIDTFVLVAVVLDYYSLSKCRRTFVLMGPKGYYRDPPHPRPHRHYTEYKYHCERYRVLFFSKLKHRSQFLFLSVHISQCHYHHNNGGVLSSLLPSSLSTGV